jgi:hypothetical protein
MFQTSEFLWFFPWCNQTSLSPNSYGFGIHRIGECIHSYSCISKIMCSKGGLSGACKEGDLPKWKDLHHTPWSGAPAILVAVGPLSRSTILKGGHAGAREPTFTVSTVPPQTLANRSDHEGAEVRGTAHRVAATIVPFTPMPPTPTTTTAAAMSSSSSAQGTSK